MSTTATTTTTPYESVDHAEAERLRKENEYIWADYAEPHIERKTRILRKHGKEINKLMGPEPLTKYVVTAVVCAQLLLAAYVPGYFFYVDGQWQFDSITSWLCFLPLCWIVGGTLNHNLFLAIHEVTHNLAFTKPIYNDYLSMFANIPIGLPYAMMFKTYHAEHHRYQGWDGIDTDVPTLAEAHLFKGLPGKFIFAFFQILFYALRPCIVRQQTLTRMHALNWLSFLSFWALYITILYKLFPYGDINNNNNNNEDDNSSLRWRPILAYFWCLLSTFNAGALHPMSGHFISEHYVFDPHSVQETFSYYGPLNILGYNVGLHNEHHDFPNVPWTRLHKVRATAPEYYDHLVKTPSWPGTVVKFILDPNVSAYSRVKREREAWKRQRLIPTDNKLAPAVAEMPKSSSSSSDNDSGNKNNNNNNAVTSVKASKQK